MSQQEHDFHLQGLRINNTVRRQYLITALTNYVDALQSDSVYGMVDDILKHVPTDDLIELVLKYELDDRVPHDILNIVHLKFDQADLDAYPPLTQIENLFSSSVITSIDFPSGDSDYKLEAESNIEFANVVIKFENGCTLTASGYNGLHEMICFDNLNEAAQTRFQVEFIGYIRSYYKDFE